MSAEMTCYQAIQSFGLKRNGKDIPYGVGCAWVGRKDLTEAVLEHDVAVLNLAYESGFRYYDTSEAYGESEVIVGEFVKGIPRETVFLATKSRVPIRISAQAAGQYVKARIEASLQRMNCSYIDLFQLHEINDFSQVHGNGGILDVLLEAKQQGRIRYIGLATRNLGLLEQAVKLDGFDAILTYSDYTPLDPKASDLIDLAHQHEVSLINGSPLCAGFLTDKAITYMPLPHEHELQYRKGLALEFMAICQAHGISVLQVALHFPLLHPFIGMTLTGPASQAELNNTLESLDREVTDEQWLLLSDWWRRINFDLPIKGKVNQVGN